jgi:protein associated with RNAse G/E
MTGEIDASARDITVRTYKYDGTEHRHWRAQISLQQDSLIVLDAKFEEEIQHPLLGTISPETLSVEYYWLDRWYNVFRFVQPAGDLRNFYCNVNVPPVLQKNVLSYIDLDIDILVAPDFSYSILDEDEFAINVKRFNYPPEIQRRSLEALEELVNLIEKRAFPFSDFK